MTRNRPWLQQTSMDRTLGFAVRITDPQLLQQLPDINAVLGGKDARASTSPAGGARSLY